MRQNAERFAWEAPSKPLDETAFVDLIAQIPPQTVTSPPLLGEVRSMLLAPPYLYVADSQAGLVVVDVSVPTAPRIAGFAFTNDHSMSTPHATGLALYQHYVYVSETSGGIGDVRIFDISDPSRPTQVGLLTMPGSATSVAVVASNLFVGVITPGGNLQILSLANPRNPTKLGEIGSKWRIAAMSPVGNVLYVNGDEYGALHAIDITDPAHPTDLGSTAIPSGAQGMAISKGNLYLYAPGGSTPGHLRVFSLDDPKQPRQVGISQGAAFGGKVAVEGQVLYIADFTPLLKVLDVSDPTTPYTIGRYQSSHQSSDVVTFKGVAFAGTFGGGLLVLRAQGH
jgi:hypothetical protein